MLEKKKKTDIWFLFSAATFHRRMSPTNSAPVTGPHFMRPTRVQVLWKNKAKKPPKNEIKKKRKRNNDPHGNGVGAKREAGNHKSNQIK